MLVVDSMSIPVVVEVPLSRGQRALWFLERLSPGTSACILAGALRVKGALDVPALRQAFGGRAGAAGARRALPHLQRGGRGGLGRGHRRGAAARAGLEPLRPGARSVAA